MRALLTSKLGRRVLRPAVRLIDERVERQVRRAVERAGGEGEEVRRLRSRQRSLELFFDQTGRGLTRMPTEAQLRKVQEELCRVTGAERRAVERNVAQAFRLLVALEALGVGRIAGGTMNIVGKLAAVPLLRSAEGAEDAEGPERAGGAEDAEGPERAGGAEDAKRAEGAKGAGSADSAASTGRVPDDVLEVGTLYGMFSAGLYRMLQRAGRTPALTIVDPFAGIQLQPGTAPNADHTGVPVDEAAVRINLGLVGADARIEKGFSADPAVRAKVADRSYGVIVVDGDHSAAGVAADLEWAERIAAPGGIVVLDDFGDPKWPGVQEAFEKHMAGPTRFSFLGQVSHSGFLRAGRAGDDDGDSDSDGSTAE